MRQRGTEAREIGAPLWCQALPIRQDAQVQRFQDASTTAGLPQSVDLSHRWDGDKLKNMWVLVNNTHKNYVPIFDLIWERHKIIHIMLL